VSAHDVFVPVVNRLMEMEMELSKVKSGGKDEDMKRSVELLFEVGLGFDGMRVSRDVGDSLKVVGRWMMKVGGEGGDWVRAERRRAIWEKYVGET
jgi:hypothetical protein